MIFAHIPAGYLLSRFLQKKMKTERFLWLGLLGSVLPDLDIIYYLAIGRRWLSHREFWMHIPIFWLAIAFAAFLILALMRRRAWLSAAALFFSSIFLHFILDTNIGGVKWLYPFTNVGYYLTIVQSRYDFWLWNFVFHWTFLLEVVIVLAAFYLIIKDLYARGKLKTKI